jgi:hypothetical protein
LNQDRAMTGSRLRLGPDRTSGRRALLGALLACAALASTQTACVSKPTLQLHHAQTSGVGPGGVNVDVYMLVNNDNSFDVQVRDFRGNVTLAGKYTFGPINWNPNQWLPSKQTTTVRVPVTIPWPVVPMILTETAGSDTVAYRVVGSADVTASRLIGIQRNDEPIDETGTMPRSMILNAARTMWPLAR